MLHDICLDTNVFKGVDMGVDMGVDIGVDMGVDMCPHLQHSHAPLNHKDVPKQIQTHMQYH